MMVRTDKGVLIPQTKFGLLSWFIFLCSLTNLYGTNTTDSKNI